MSQRVQILRIFDPCTDDLGKSTEEMNARCRELVAADKATVVSKPFLDVIVVKGSQSDGCFPDPSWTNESYRTEVFGEIDELLNQVVAPETGPRPRGRWLPRYTRYRCKLQNSSVVEAVDLFWA